MPSPWLSFALACRVFHRVSTSSFAVCIVSFSYPHGHPIGSLRSSSPHPVQLATYPYISPVFAYRSPVSAAFPPHSGSGHANNGVELTAADRSVFVCPGFMLLVCCFSAAAVHSGRWALAGVNLGFFCGMFARRNMGRCICSRCPCRI